MHTREPGPLTLWSVIVKNRRTGTRRWSATRLSVVAFVLLLIAAFAGSQIFASQEPASLTISPSSVVGGNPVTGTIKLQNPAPSDGARFWVKSTDESIA